MTFTWSDLTNALSTWGHEVIITVVVLFVVYKLAGAFLALCDRFATEFLKTQRDQADGLSRLASGTEKLQSAMEAATQRDNGEHREMTILLKCIMEKVETIEERTYEGR